MNIYVGNLPHATSDSELRELFEEYGTVEKATIIKDRDTGRSRGFGFVEMPDQGEAETAVAELSDVVVKPYVCLPKDVHPAGVPAA